jgi:hypothetical protein
MSKPLSIEQLPCPVLRWVYAAITDPRIDQETQIAACANAFLAKKTGSFSATNQQIVDFVNEHLDEWTNIRTAILASEGKR